MRLFQHIAAFAIAVGLFISPGPLQAPPAAAASAYEIDSDVNATLDRFFYNVRGAADLLNRAAGVLVFPSVVKAGIGVGGEYGEGALRVAGRSVGYYNTISASVGFQLGVQARSVIIAFMTSDSLERFRRTDGWKIGADASVAVITLGVGGSVDSNQVKNPVVAFVLDNKGLMYNLTLEGTKISRISR